MPARRRAGQSTKLLTGITQIAGVTALVGSDLDPQRVDLTITNGRIDSVEPALPKSSWASSELDGRGLLAMPGMVDCHDHLRHLDPARSAGRGLPFDQFLAALTAGAAAMGPTEYELGVLLGLVQRLKVGITTVADHCYPYHRPGLDEAVLAGYRRSGARWVYARGIQTIPAQVAEPWDDAEGRIRELVESGRLPADRLLISPVSIRQAEPPDYVRSRALADELGCGLYTHVAETPAELERWQQLTGQSPIRALAELGFLTDRTVLVHCVLLDDGEIDLLAAHGCHVIHCPSNHMRFGKGFTRVPDLLAAGVNVALGVDNELDLLTEMRLERGLQSLATKDVEAVSLQTVLEMATWRGANALGLDGQTGRIEPGMAADVALIDARSIVQAPMLDPQYALVYMTHPGHVRHVLVDGELVVRDGSCITVDEEALVAEVEEVAEAWLARIG